MQDHSRTTWAVMGALWLASSGLLFGGCDSSDSTMGSIDCATRGDHWYRVRVSGEAELAISVDTVSLATAFDPAFSVYAVDTWSTDPADIVLGGYVDDADDDFECTYPPTAYGCPAALVIVHEDVLLEVENYGSCQGEVGRYELTVIGADSVTFLGEEP